MEKPLYESLRAHLKEQSSKGVKLDPKILLEDVERMAFQDPQLREARLANYQYRLTRHKDKADYKKELFGATISTAVMAVKSGILINGGACIAVLGLLAAIMKDNSQSVYAFDMNHSLACFGAGVLFGALTTAAVYFAQYYFQQSLEYRREKRLASLKKANTFRGIGIALIFLCYACFLGGLFFGFKGLP